MSNIKEITLYNFKAFNGETKIQLDGKNLLMYGENGSGKSSIYWALYTLLQSSTKKAGETDKYFDFNHEENLINRDYLIELDKTRGIGNYSADIGKNVQIEIKTEDSNIYNLTLGGLSSATNKTALADLNRYCDFITHRLLINFYNFRNSQEIDLWKIFKREIFPFVYNKNDKGDETIETLIKELYDEQPFQISADKKYELLTPDETIFEYFEKIKTANIEISELVFKIENEANEFFSKHFDNSDNEYKLSLTYTNKFFFGYNIIDDRENDKINGSTNLLKLLRTPKIILKIYKKAHNSFELITRPQTYLNEALITQLSLSIRLALTKSRAVNYPGQFLVLDDMLISLDMSNRDKVLDIILNEFAPKYKIYLFTHERSFFNMVKRRLDYSGQLSNWKIREMYQIPDSGINSPKDFPSNSFFAQAQYHKNSNPPDYPASVNYLRKELEEILKTFLPKEIFKNNDGTNKDKLNDKIIATKYLFNRLKINLEIINQIDDYIFLLLNPLSHSDLESEIYKTDIEKIFNLLTTFRQDCETLKPLIKKVLPRATKIKMVLNKNATTANEYLISIEEDVFIYSPPSGSGIFSDSELNKEIICYEIVNSIKGENFNVSLNKDQKESMQKFYEQTCNKEGVAVNTKYLEHFEKLDGTKLNTFI